MNTLRFEPFYQDYLNTLGAYRLALSTMYTDQATIAPRDGAPAANQAMAILSQAAFEIENDPAMHQRIQEYADRLEDGTLEKQEVLLRLQALDESRKIPADLYGKAARIRADSETAWHRARESGDFAVFRPHLEAIMEITKELARCSDKYDGTNLYDVLLDQYERGLDQKQYDEFFDVIRRDLIPLIEKVRQARPIDTAPIRRRVPVEVQEAFAGELLDFLQADGNKVYLSTTEHPFTDFFSLNDVRITTHYYPDQFLSAVLSTVHEYGHALYVLQSSPAFENTAFISAIGSAAHESQSRFLENNIGRSRAFWKGLYPRLQKAVPAFEDVPFEDMINAINASACTLIRTEADELTYPLHILIRYELEKLIAADQVSYDDLPKLWADKYEEYLGIRPQNDREGILQDMHWSAGNFGYFPTYALGSAYAAQLFEAMEKEIDVQSCLEKGDMAPIAAWLKEKVHQYGACKSMREIVEQVSGKPFDPTIYTSYLKDKYTKLYHLED